MNFKLTALSVFLFIAAKTMSQGVVVGGLIPDTSAMLEIRSTEKGLLLPRMTSNQRDQIIMPAAGLVIFNTNTNCPEYYNGEYWLSMCGVATSLKKNCRDIKLETPTAASGTYFIDIDSSGPLAPMKCYCDMSTDGGGWTLILNYNHRANTDSVLTILTNRFPLMGNSAIPGETNPAAWGHVGNLLAQKLDFSEVRFYGKTSDHPRIMHFKTSHAGTVNYIKSGSGSMNGLQYSFSPIAGHSSYLPGGAQNFLTNQGDLALTMFPFFQSCNYHWAIKAPTLGINRWEIDNTLCSSCCSIVHGIIRDTHHQVWIR